MIVIILLILAFIGGLKIQKNYAPKLYIEALNLKLQTTKEGVVKTTVLL